MARRLLLGLWGLGAGAVLAFVLSPQSSSWQPWMLLAALPVTALAAARAAKLGEGATLHWDGQHWECNDPRLGRLAPAQALVHLDLQRLMLVCLHAEGQPARWLWLERPEPRGQWLDLRRALFARAPAAPQPGRGLARSGKTAS